MWVTGETGGLGEAEDVSARAAAAREIQRSRWRPAAEAWDSIPVGTPVRVPVALGGRCSVDATQAFRVSGAVRPIESPDPRFGASPDRLSL